MSASKEGVTASSAAEGVREYVPLNRLKKSPKNIRKVSHSRGFIHSLAATIHSHGQTHNVVVEPEIQEGVPTGYYFVTDGEGRRLAQLHRVKLGQIPEDHPIPCLIDSRHMAESLSTAGNFFNPLHPADQFEAFKTMVNSGKSIQEVADEFGIDRHVVKRRLELANVCPDFIEMYRQGTDGVTLEHLMALAVTDDHDRQRKAWQSLPKHYRHASALRDALTREEISTQSPIARFVADAYRKAGGPVRKYLFSETGEGFILDIELFNRLVDEKLARAVAKIKREGIAWVDATPRLLYSDLSMYSRVETIQREPTEDETRRLAALRDEEQALQAEANGLTEDEDERAQAIEDRLDEIHEAREAISESCREADPEQRSVAGAIVTIGPTGKLKIERGLIKPEDKKRLSVKARAAEGESEGAARSNADRTHSAVLLRRLTAHKTLALRAVLAENPKAALLAITHRLLSHTFFYLRNADSPLQIDGLHTDLQGYGEDVRVSKAYKALDQTQELLAKQLPKDGAMLLPWLAEQSHETIMGLLAFCVARTVCDVRGDEGPSSLNALAKVAGLDMRDWWEATEASYFGSISKACIVSAVTEAAGPEAAASLPALKKSAAGNAAERAVAGKGWLPPVLRVKE